MRRTTTQESARGVAVYSVRTTSTVFAAEPRTAHRRESRPLARRWLTVRVDTPARIHTPRTLTARHESGWMPSMTTKAAWCELDLACVVYAASAASAASAI